MKKPKSSDVVEAFCHRSVETMKNAIWCYCNYPKRYHSSSSLQTLQEEAFGKCFSFYIHHGQPLCAKKLWSRSSIGWQKHKRHTLIRQANLDKKWATRQETWYIIRSQIKDQRKFPKFTTLDLSWLVMDACDCNFCHREQCIMYFMCHD